MKKAVVVWIAVACLAALNMMRFGPEPDAVYPMANKHIEWHYAGK